MDKNFTPTIPTSSSTKPSEIGPSKFTLAQIRQFAHSYMCMQQLQPFGGIILN